MSQRRWAFSLVVVAVTVRLGASEQPSVPRGFIGGGMAAAFQGEQPGFGGYFCCDAGGAALGLTVRGGLRLSSRWSLQGELLVPRSFTDNLTAPRFIQENRHRDTVLSLVAGFHPANTWRIRPALLAGAGVALARTESTVQHLMLTSGGPTFLPGPSLTRGETRPAITLGMEVGVALNESVSLVPYARGRFIWRSDAARFDEGLGRLGLVSGLSVQWDF